MSDGRRAGEQGEAACAERTCAPLAGLKLTQLTLPGRHAVTDSGLELLSRLTLLSELDLTEYTEVTDRGVSRLGAMTRSPRTSSPFVAAVYVC